MYNVKSFFKEKISHLKNVSIIVYHSEHSEFMEVMHDL